LIAPRSGNPDFRRRSSSYGGLAQPPVLTPKA